MKWPYKIKYGYEKEISTDVLVIGGGIAGCWSAITIAEKDLKVAIVEKGATIRSGEGGSVVDYCQFVRDAPRCEIPAKELADALIENTGRYTNGISRYIGAVEEYDALCEMEKMGAKFEMPLMSSRARHFRMKGQRFCSLTTLKSNTAFVYGEQILSPCCLKSRGRKDPRLCSHTSH